MCKYDILKQYFNFKEAFNRQCKNYNGIWRMDTNYYLTLRIKNFGAYDEFAYSFVNCDIQEAGICLGNDKQKAYNSFIEIQSKNIIIEWVQEYEEM